MWMAMVMAALGQSREYVVDDVVIGVKSGMSAAGLEAVARRACTPACTFIDEQIGMLLRSGVSPEVIEIMIGKALTDAQLARGAVIGPPWHVTLSETQPVNNDYTTLAPRLRTSDFERQAPTQTRPEGPSSAGRPGPVLTWLGVGTSVAGLTGLLLLNATEQSYEDINILDPDEVERFTDATRTRGTARTIFAIGVGVGVSWTGAGIAITAGVR